LVSLLPPAFERPCLRGLLKAAGCWDFLANGSEYAYWGGAGILAPGWRHRPHGLGAA